MHRLNQVAAETRAQAIIHTGDFGFYTRQSIQHMSDRSLRSIVQHSPLLSPKLRSVLLDSAEPRDKPAAAPSSLRQMLLDQKESLLSEFAQLRSGSIRLSVPVYTVWGACEDVQVLERFRTGEYAVPNLHVLDEASAPALDVGGVRLRLLGLGGAVVLHKLFDVGRGNGTIAGAQGAMWTTMLQVGELIETAQQVYDPSEVRVLVTHASPGREGLIAQLAHALHADFTVSGGLHFRYTTSYNDFTLHPSLEAYRHKLAQAKAAFEEVWDAVKHQVDAAIDGSQRPLLAHALGVALRVPQPFAPGAARDESAWKNAWHWNLPDVAFGSLVLDIAGGRVSAETHSQGISFAYRRGGAPARTAAAPRSNVALPQPAGRAEKAGEKAAAGAANSRADQTLFLGHFGEAHPVVEKDVRAYFGPHAEQIEKVHFFSTERSSRRNKDEAKPEEQRVRNFVHVTFKSEAAAQVALAKCRGQTIKGTSVVPTLDTLLRNKGKKEEKPRAEPNGEPAPAQPTSSSGSSRRGGRRRCGRDRKDKGEKSEEKAEAKADGKPEEKPEGKPEAKADGKPEAKPEAEAKPSKPEAEAKPQPSETA